MTLDEMEAQKNQKFLQFVMEALSKSTWGMSIAQIAQSARLSVKTVHNVIKDHPDRFNVSDGVYTLRGQDIEPKPKNKPGKPEKAKTTLPRPTPPKKPEPIVVSIPGIDARLNVSKNVGAEMDPGQPAEPLISILGIPLNVEPGTTETKETAPDPILERDQVILDEMLEVVKKHPTGILSRDLMMVLNIRRDQVYQYADLLISQNKIHRMARTNRQIKYKYGPSPVPVLEHNDFSDLVKTTVIQKREVTLTQEEVEQVLLRVFGMEKIQFVSTAKGIAVAMVAEVEY